MAAPRDFFHDFIYLYLIYMDWKDQKSQDDFIRAVQEQMMGLSTHKLLIPRGNSTTMEMLFIVSVL
uniref:Uncharacterized protein n=1 Tax=Leersia perrieri TaxID=77586 RepID=A0A0D9WYY0_9ORYZ